MVFWDGAQIVPGIYVKIEIREQSAYPKRYAAQVSCPESCEAFYNSEWNLSPNKAKGNVVASLRKHYRKKHL